MSVELRLPPLSVSICFLRGVITIDDPASFPRLKRPDTYSPNCPGRYVVVGGHDIPNSELGADTCSHTRTSAGENWRAARMWWMIRLKSAS